MKIKRMFAAAKQSSELLLYVYDQIGSDWFSNGVTAKGVADEIKKAGTITSITMRINSPGGDVFEALAIFNLIKAQSVPVNVFIDGLAASAASVLAMVGDKIAIADNAMMMIHNAWTIALGDANEMRRTADLLDKISGVIVDTYAKRSGESAEDIKAMMDAETWLTSQEAVDEGLADEVTATDKKDSTEAQAVAASFDLSRFAKTPEKFKSAVAPQCACDCAECEKSNCVNCTNPLCTDQSCSHGNMSAAVQREVGARDAREKHTETLLKQ